MSTVTLFRLVRTLLHEYHVIDSEDTTFTEAICIRRLAKTVRKCKELKNVYSHLFPSSTFTEPMLPLIARAIGSTIGLTDANNNIVMIPGQWFSKLTYEYSESVSHNDYEEEEDQIEIIRRVATDKYVRDYDDEYITKYEMNIQTHGWTFTTDTIPVTFTGSHDASSSFYESLSNKSSSNHASKLETQTPLKAPLLRHDQKGVYMFDVWSHHSLFSTTTSTSSTSETAYPSVIDPDFQQKLYTSRGFRPKDIGVRTKGDTTGVITLSDHQQIVRNYMSPLTPYNSLLLIHATGTGKTLTALGIAETFRDYVYSQNKRIHIACPREEVSKEFRNYLADTSIAGGIIRTPYEKEAMALRNDVVKPLPSDHSYCIENHSSIFSKRIRYTVGHLFQLIHTWQQLMPKDTLIERVHLPQEGFRLSHHEPMSQTTLKSTKARFQKAKQCITQFMGGEHSFVHTVEVNDKKNGIIVMVTEIEPLIVFEEFIVNTYANTLFIIDEAHNFPTDTTNESEQESNDTFSANWRTILLAVIGMLHFYNERMRLVLLTATPMTNADMDLYVLLNLMIRNDGIQGEPLLVETMKHANLSPKNLETLKQCIQSRVSYYENDNGKPLQMHVDDMWYNVPTAIANQNEFTVVTGEDKNTSTHVVCHPSMTIQDIVNAFIIHQSKTTIASSFVAKPVSLHVYATKTNMLEAKQTYHRSSHDAPKTTCRHIYIAFHEQPGEVAIKDINEFTQSFIPGIDIVHVITNQLSVAKYVATNSSVRTALYSIASEHRPLWFPTIPNRHQSIYKTSYPPQFYSYRCGNLPYFFNTYLNIKATNDTCKYDFSIVTTRIQNEAISPQSKHEKDRGVPYSFSKHIRNIWNIHDKDDVVYHPKIDTMFDLMEAHSGNVFIYTAEPRIHPGQNYSRFMVFLKRAIERRFKQDHSSRLKHVHVEVLHKGTIPYLNKLEGNLVQLPTELNERVKQLNESMLHDRDDIVLIGSQEVMEGLTFKEIRQVHILDPMWNMASMDQVMGRAIRFGSHSKHAQQQDRNVTCFLHVTVPNNPSDNCFHNKEQSTSLTVKYQNFPSLVRYVSDLHAYYRVHRKNTPIYRLLNMLRADSMDAVYRDWTPTLNATNAVLINMSHEGNTNKKNYISRLPWRTHAFINIHEQQHLFELIVERRLCLGLISLDEPTNTEVKGEEPDVPLARYQITNEIDWYRHQIIRLFERIAHPVLTFDEILTYVHQYGPQHVITHQPLSVTVDIESVCKRFDIDYQRGHITLETLLGSTVNSTVRKHVVKLVQYSLYKWHVVTNAKGFELRVNAQSVVDRLYDCPDVNDACLLNFPKGCKSLDMTNDTKLCKIIMLLPKSLQDSITDLCTPKCHNSTDIPMMYRGTSKRNRSINDKKRTQRRMTNQTLCNNTLTDLKIQNIRQEAVAYALDDIIRQRLCIEREHGTLSTLILENNYYTLESLALPRSLKIWNIPNTSTDRIITTLPYSSSLPMTSKKNDDILQAIILEVHNVFVWLKTCIQLTRSTAYVQSIQDVLSHESCTWLEQMSFDSLSFDDQDAILGFLAVHGLEPIDKVVHPLQSDPKVYEALQTIKRAVAHRYAEKKINQTCYPHSAKSLLFDSFESTVQVRLFCTFPRNPAKESCDVHIYTQTRFTGNTSLKPFTKYQLHGTKLRAWEGYFSPTPVITADTDIHATFYPSKHVRIGACSQAPIDGPTRYIGYGEVLNYRDPAAGRFVYRFVDATKCETRENNGLPLSDQRVRERIESCGDITYLQWENCWLTTCKQHVHPNWHYCTIDPICVARIIYLRSKKSFFRYFFPGVQPQHPLTKQLYAGWRSRKKKIR